MPDIPNRALLFDTSPLITLATARIDGRPIIERLLPLIPNLTIVQTVANEATANLAYRDARVIKALLESGQLVPKPVPVTPVDILINAYTKIQAGERDTIRLGLSISGVCVVVDDLQAFFIAARFDLNPISLLDTLVSLRERQLLTKEFALSVVDSIERTSRFTSASLQHTVYKINQVDNDTNHT